MPLLKRWERPSEGPRRNDKSRQASARLRQIKKATKVQMKRLRERGRFSFERHSQESNLAF